MIIEFMIIGTRQQLTKVTVDRLIVGNSSITTVSKARNLGVWFDSNMNFNVHITKTCNLAFTFYITYDVSESTLHTSLRKSLYLLWLLNTWIIAIVTTCSKRSS